MKTHFDIKILDLGTLILMPSALEPPPAHKCLVMGLAAVYDD